LADERDGGATRGVEGAGEASTGVPATSPLFRSSASFTSRALLFLLSEGLMLTFTSCVKSWSEYILEWGRKREMNT
jgi:hypothetical protein